MISEIKHTTQIVYMFAACGKWNVQKSRAKYEPNPQHGTAPREHD